MSSGKPKHSPSQFWFTPDFRMGLHHFRYSRNQFDCLPHTHSDYHFMICLGGAMETICSSQRVTVKPGEVHTVNPGEVHCSRMGILDSPSEGITLILDKETLEDIIRKIHLPRLRHFDDIMFLGKCFDQDVQRLGQELVRELVERRAGYEVVVQSLLIQALVCLLRNCLEPSASIDLRQLPPQLPSWQITRAFEYMNQHNKSNFSLPELCSEVGSSLSRFIPLFRNSTQLTPSLFYNKLVMVKAQMLLQASGFSTKEVAYTLGFKKVSHFCVLFHKICGLTPTAFQHFV
jgi:AraC-like DNA-binding protein